jgi:hypothetical protein
MPTTATTAFKQPRDVASTHKLQFVVYTGPATYVAGGDSLLPADVGFSNIDYVEAGLAWNGTAVRLVVYDYTNQKLIWYVPNTGSEASGDLSAFTLRIVIFGS